MPNCKITPSFVFHGSAEEAADFYVSVFPDSKIVKKTVAAEDQPGGVKAGEVSMVSFELMGIHMVAANSEGENFSIGQGLSLYVECEDQKMIDTLTKKLLDGGGEQQPCGWVKDQFGVSWQIAPTIVNEVIESKDEETTQRMLAALYQMKKIDIAQLERAVNGGN